MDPLKKKCRSGGTTSSKDFPIIDSPGPDCSHPQRLCMVADTYICPHALTPFVRKGSAHTMTRCAKDLPRQMDVREIAQVLGISSDYVKQVTAQALAKLRKRTDPDWGT